MLKTVPVTDENRFDVLSTDESDSDDSSFETAPVIAGNSRKRRNISSTRPHQKGQKVSKVGKPILSNEAKGNADKKSKKTAPGLTNLNSDKEFPALPGTSKLPPKVPPSQSDAGLLKFSDIVEWIFKAFSITEPLKGIPTAFLPTVTTFLKQLTAQWLLLAAIVSCDG